MQFEFGKPGALEEALFACPGSAQHADSGAGQPACDESQHLSAGSVKPRQVIDDNQDWLSLCCLAQQCEGGVGYHQPVRSCALAETQCHVECVTMGSGEAREVREQRNQGLVEPGEADRSLEFDSAGTQHAYPSR